MSNPRPQNHIGDHLVQLTVELTNRCNLHCRYCVRDEEALYHTPAHFLPPALLRRIMKEAREAWGLQYISFTGGEATIHPQFGEILALVAAEGLQCGFITNGWHFARVFSAVLAQRAAVRVVAFSLDGATSEAHDKWRGKGSFVRVMRAVTRCYVSGLPFIIKVVIRRDTLPQLEQLALLAARLGAAALHFSHLLPTSVEVEAELALSLPERQQAEEEIGILGKILKMPVGVSIGHYDLDPAPPCPALRGTTCNVDYLGHLTLCCNLSGYRGAGAEPDVIADLTREDFASAYARLRQVAETQIARRQAALEARKQGGEADLYVGSPCLLCLQSFGKLPWRGDSTAASKLTVLQRYSQTGD
jgi:MoaA/NifB/PqqE/SkfB family radical SAM enzyme